MTAAPGLGSSRAGKRECRGLCPIGDDVVKTDAGDELG
jgi:hypothetical protein